MATIRSEHRQFEAEVKLQEIGNPVYEIRGKFIPDDEYVYVNLFERCQVFWGDGRITNIVVGGNRCVGERRFEFYFIVK